MAIRDENIAVRSDEDVRRLIESIRTVASDSGFAESHQDFSVRAELENLMAFDVFSRAVSHPHVSLSIDMNSVRADEHPRAKTLHELARRIKFKERRQI